MGQAVPGQHPAAVARSQFNLLRALLAAALIAVIALTVAVVILASDVGRGGFDPATGRPESAPQAKREAQAPAGSTRYVVPTTRHDGGPEEGSRGSDR